MDEQKTGEVILVGAGCERGLMTISGMQALKKAEILIYDDLIDPALLEEIEEGCRTVYVGKRSGAHSMKQEEINRMLAEEAKRGRCVVRLKGGDSFVFGRGGEELLALRKLGIRCRVIPGITSAVAVPEHMGIPVTHRGAAQSFTVVTGHTATEQEENYEALAKLRGTLIFLMGIRSLKEITERLMRFGKDPKTPAAVLTRGFTAAEERIDGTLGTIAVQAEQASTPGILVVGETAALDLREGKQGTGQRETPDKWEMRDALKGCSATVTGTCSFTERMADRLEERGASVLRRPCMELVPRTEQILAALKTGDYRWIVFTSGNGVEIFFRHLADAGFDLRGLWGIRFACIGSGTAGVLRRRGFAADLIPAQYTAKALGRALGETVQEGRVLILRSEDGSAELTDALRERGIPYTDLPIYKMVPMDKTDGIPWRKRGNKPEGGTKEEQEPVSEGKRWKAETDYIVFGSAGCVRMSIAQMEIPDRVIPVCIGEYTAEAFRRETGREPLVAAVYTAEGIAAVMEQDFQRRRQGRAESETV